MYIRIPAKRGYVYRIPLLFVFLFLLSWGLFAFNRGNADYANYYQVYELLGSGAKDQYLEIGFRLLMIICNKLHMPYELFLLIVASITHILLFSSLEYLLEYKKNITIVWLSYVIYPYFFDIVQYRAFLGYVICFWGLRYLFGEKKHPVKYFIAVLVSTLFHTSMILYLAFILVLLPTSKMKPIVVAGCAAITFICVNTDLLRYIFGLVGLSKYARYDWTAYYSTFIQYFAVWIFFFVLIGRKYRWDFSNRYLKLTLVALLFVPFSLFGGTPARLFRNMFVFFYCGVFDRKTRSIWDIPALLAVLFVAYMQLWNGIHWLHVTLPIFTENALWR